jgi:hypothetical protein
MKKLVSLAIILMMSTMVFSQTTKDELKIAREIFGMEKKEMVQNFVNLPENNVFWTIYKEYDEGRKVFGEARYDLLLEYAGNYVNYSDDRLEIILAESMNNRKKAEKHFLKTYKKIKKECGVKTASQFYMVERFFESSIQATVLGNLPIVEN